jgi:ABC-type bacteriocin/lantibiotic exporter with double-glycine peptidase domain
VSGGPRRLAPEVVQTSGMDCGPAALKCLLEGFGIHASYGRLREACQTDVDGTSIDALEEIAGRLGLDATQVMLPPDHLLLPESRALPAIVLLRLPNGLTHFVVVWRRHGRLVQVMDPAVGRRWMTIRRLRDELFIHTQPVHADAWRVWAGSSGYLAGLRRRLTDVGVRRAAIEELTGVALADPTWRGPAALDAATRAVAEVVSAGGLRAGPTSELVLRRLVEQARRDDEEDPVMPRSAWSVRPDPDARGEERLLLRGAVLVSVPGRRTSELDATALSPELVAALAEPPASPARDLLRLLRADGLLRPALVAVAAVTAAAGVVIEALLFRALIDGVFGLGNSPTRAVAALIAIVAVLLALQAGIAAGALGVGRRLEGRLRAACLSALPGLPDRYFRSRPVSDMAERAHLIHQLRLLPDLGAELVGVIVQLGLVTVGIVWLDPASAPPAVLAAVLALVLALGMQAPLRERDLRLRNHSGALSRFSLDALLGLVALRAHAGERAVRHEHDALLGTWSRAGVAVVRATVSAEALQTVAGFALAIWIVAAYLPRAEEPGTALLLVYWALTLPLLGQQIGLLARQYPMHRNLTLRFLEPLGASRDGANAEPSSADVTAEDESPGASAGRVATRRRARAPASSGVAISMRGVSVHAAGHVVLDELELEVPAGSHLAIVGPAGAGKSSLLGLLLGWHTPAEGSLLVDGSPLGADRLARLRLQTTWVDPGVQLWNRSLGSNLRYGAEDSALRLDTALGGAELEGVIARLPDGLETALGEGGGLVSGGEGQRVRLGRALLRESVQLALLDEPFRGLDRTQRARLLARVRQTWRTATLLCVTHDLRASATFERVVVIDGGRVVEDGNPAELSSRPGSRYRDLLEAEDAVRQELSAGPSWRRIRLADGRLEETARARRTR